MKKLTIAILLIVLCIGCRGRLHIGENRVVGINYISNCQCEYECLSTYAAFKNPSFFDSCNKWKIGDTVYISNHK